MSWVPDDSVIEGPDAVNRIKQALSDNNIDPAGRVTTSKHKEMDKVKKRLERQGMPAGIKSWELPVLTNGGAFVFLTEVGAGAEVPVHQHTRDLFRVVISGSITLDDGTVLGSGDWMFVPKGVSYGYKGATNPGAVILHFYD
jgi:quercetin dioxygenase-like cupin family protein